MAVAFNAASQTSRWGSGSSNQIIISHTVAGANTYMFVGISTNQAVTPTSVTYNGDALALVASKTDTDYDIWVYGMVAPDDGTHDVTVTLSGATMFIHGQALSYTGVDQTDPIGDTSTNANTSGSPTQSVDTETANSWIVDFLTISTDGASVSPLDGQTERQKTALGIIFAAYDQATTSAGTYDSDYDLTSGEWTIVSSELKEAGGAAATYISAPLNII